MKHIIFLLVFCLLIACLSIPALAVDSYHFTTTDTEELYQPGVTTVTYEGLIPGYIQQLYDFTPQTIRTSEYGATIIAPERDAGYGLASERPAYAPGASSGGSVDAAYPTAASASNGYALTAIEDVRQSDGSIGTLKIPAIGLIVTAWDGEATTPPAPLRLPGFFVVGVT